jgi:UDP-glucose 4-epimerase
MRVLVTGGAGFLGRHFVHHHLEQGDYVVSVDDLSAHEPTDVPADVMDVTEVADIIEWMATSAEKFDLAYHFAAPVGGRLKIEGDPLFNAHSLGIDEAFFRWAPGRVGRAVYPSSSAVYGKWHQRDLAATALSEDMYLPGASSRWPVPDEMYGFTKLAGEFLAYKAAPYGLNTLCIRPFSGYGEGQSFDYPVPSIARRAIRKENPLTIWGSGEQSRDFIHVSDVVAGTLARLDYPLNGQNSMNLGSGHAVTFRMVAELCAGLVGYQPEIVSDESKPEGVKKRFANVERMHTYYEAKVPLRVGLKRVLADVEQRMGA